MKYWKKLSRQLIKLKTNLIKKLTENITLKKILIYTKTFIIHLYIANINECEKWKANNLVDRKKLS